MTNVNIRSSALRLGIFISILVLATILVFQLVWLKRVYEFEQKNFNHSVIKAIRGLYEDLDITEYNSSTLSKLVEEPVQHLFIAKMQTPANADSLANYLQYELEDFEIFTACHMGIYSVKNGTYVYDTVLTSVGKKEKSLSALPLIPRKYNYLALYFPNRQRYILSQMNFWIITSAVLLIVLMLMGGSLYFFFRQKFLNETQKDFIHNFTHEFKTPVAVIGLAADVLKDKNITTKPEKLSTYANIVEYQANYLHSQIERLLKFAYTDSNHIHLVKEKVDVHQLIEEAVANLAPLITEKKAVLNYTLEASNSIVPADKGYLLIVITNLIDNAIKYSKDPDISIQTANSGNSFLLSVKDNGIGIDKKYINRLFQKFFRARAGEVYAAKGFGIGLTFVKKIVDAHKGKIKVESTPGKGSTFTIQLSQKQ